MRSRGENGPADGRECDLIEAGLNEAAVVCYGNEGGDDAAASDPKYEAPR